MTGLDGRVAIVTGGAGLAGDNNATASIAW